MYFRSNDWGLLMIILDLETSWETLICRDGIALHKKIDLKYFNLIVSDNLIILIDETFSNASVFDIEDVEENLIWEGSLDIFHNQEVKFSLYRAILIMIEIIVKDSFILPIRVRISKSHSTSFWK